MYTIVHQIYPPTLICCCCCCCWGLGGGCCMVTVVKTFKSKEAEDEYALTQLLACDLKSHC